MISSSSPKSTHDLYASAHHSLCSKRQKDVKFPLHYFNGKPVSRLELQKNNFQQSRIQKVLLLILDFLFFFCFSVVLVSLQCFHESCQKFFCILNYIFQVGSVSGRPFLVRYFTFKILVKGLLKLKL